MIGVINHWRVLPDCYLQHSNLMSEILRLQRQQCPEVLMNLAFGPSSDGSSAEVQLFASSATYEAFADRVRREVPALQEVWERHTPLCVPNSLHTTFFEGQEFLSDSFVRSSTALGFVEAQPLPPASGKLEGKVAIVTGAHRGNGRAIALALAQNGAHVAVWDLSLPTLEKVRTEIEALGRRCLALQVDVTDEVGVQQAIAQTVGELGALDIVVNNAGVFPFKPIGEFSAEEFGRVLQVNLQGPWLMAKHALPYLQRRAGCIINITSCSGHYGGASAGGSAYDSSKGGLRQLTCSLATEFGPLGVRVNAIAPGVIATEATGGAAMVASAYGQAEIARTPLRRIGTAEDVGSVAAFLAGPDASYVNGITIILDGGAMSAW